MAIVYRIRVGVLHLLLILNLLLTTTSTRTLLCKVRPPLKGEVGVNRKTTTNTGLIFLTPLRLYQMYNPTPLRCQGLFSYYGK